MSKRLLLADDSITIQKVIQITFAHENYELTITDNGDAALGKAREIVPDLVMTDIYMPGKNGYELTSAIKQDPALQHIPVLLLAGSFEPFDEDKARQCKADAWIEKPFESQSLIDKVAELLSAAQPAAPAEAPAAAPAVPAMEMPEPEASAPPVAARPALDDDPFGDISFEDEVDTPVEPPKPSVAKDDWSDLAVEPAPAPAVTPAEIRIDAVADVEEDAFAADDFTFSEELLETAAETEEDFAFAEETLPEMPAEEVEDFAFAAEAPVAEPSFAPFDPAEEEIMPLGDDDILGAEDLEPLAGEQTLSPWSRDAIEDEDIFAEPLEEETPVEFAVETPVVPRDFPAEAPVAEFVQPEEDALYADTFAEGLPETGFAPEPEAEPVAPVAAEATQPAAALTVADVEKRVAAVSEEEIERIIESVVSRIVEKLAGSILEKVAWEVVPDLAEGLIREEIRRIKDDAA